LRSRFEHVFLVDIRHPAQIIKKVESMNEVDLIEADLSGGAISKLWDLAHKKTQAKGASLLDQLSLQPPLRHIAPDAVISVNLLNQLDIILCDYMSRKGYFQQEESRLLRSALQEFHLQWITETPGCLVSDVLEKNTDKKGEISSKSLLYTTLPEGIRSDSWTWEFDSAGSYRIHTHTSMEVKAVEWA